MDLCVKCVDHIIRNWIIRYRIKKAIANDLVVDSEAPVRRLLKEKERNIPSVVTFVLIGMWVAGLSVYVFGGK